MPNDEEHKLVGALVGLLALVILLYVMTSGHYGRFGCSALPREDGLMEPRNGCIRNGFQYDAVIEREFFKLTSK